MKGSAGGGEVMRRFPVGAISRAAKLSIVLSVPSVFACAGGAMLVPVFLPGERVDCLFEVVGQVTVQGPFRGQDDDDATAREIILQGVRLEVGQEAADSGADAVMVREFLYDRDPTVSEADLPEIVSVEGMLLSFVDPTCVEDGST